MCVRVCVYACVCVCECLRECVCLRACMNVCVPVNAVPLCVVSAPYRTVLVTLTVMSSVLPQTALLSMVNSTLGQNLTMKEVRTSVDVT